MTGRRSRTLDIYLHGRMVGHVNRDGPFEIRYSYADAVVEAAAAGDRSGTLSIGMPLERRSYGKAHSRAFFDGLLPEDVVRTRIANSLHINAQDTFALLEELAGDTAGAVVALPPDAAQELSSPSDDRRPLPLTDPQLAHLV
ncbi:MAG: HipA N-terminal domain-containing protein, partial [Thermoleophilia bacterium]|nr:HipA N-terminal domain-containing protein [Thermoleophilia bacterium]